MAQVKDMPEEPTRETEEGRFLADQLKILWEGEAWHGPALRELLDGVTAEQAAGRPVPGGHTVWELVLHVAAWTDVFRRRLEGERIEEPEDGDFPSVGEPTPEGWSAALARLGRAQDWIVRRAGRLTRADLDGPVPGRDYTRRFQVHAAMSHLVYHSGQIALLKKA